MCGTGIIVNFYWLSFATLLIGSNPLTQETSFFKWSLNTIYLVNCLFVRLSILCVKIRAFRPFALELRGNVTSFL